MIRYALAVAIALAPAFGPTASAQGLPAKKPVITQAELIPKRTVTLQRLPSQYLNGPRADILALVQSYENNLRGDLAQYDIQNDALRLAYYSQLMSLAQFKQDWEGVAQLASQMRPLTRRAGSAATVGVLPGILGEQLTGKHNAAWVRREVEKRFGEMSWADAGDIIKSMHKQIAQFDPEQVRRTFEQQLDATAQQQQMVLPESVITAIASSRVQIELVAPVKYEIVSGLQAVIDRNTPKAAASGASK